MGAEFLYLRLPVLPTGIINFNTSGDNIILPVIPSNRIGIQRLWLRTAGATVLIFKDGAGNALTGPVSLDTNQEIKWDLSGEPWLSLPVGSAFIINSSQSVQVGGIVYYFVSLGPPSLAGFVLMEDGSYMNTEDGTRIVLEG